MASDLLGPLPAFHPPHIKPGDARPHGEFYTPDALALAICKTLRDQCGVMPSKVFEPGCGGGAFLRGVRGAWPEVPLLGVDLLPACSGPGLVLPMDLFEIDLQTEDDIDLIIGNPDYAIAEKVVRHCLGLLAPGGHLAFLLRAAFLGSSGRVPLFTDYPLRYLQPIAQRPSFTADGKTDPMEYCLFAWQAGFKGRGELLPGLVWR